MGRLALALVAVVLIAGCSAPLSFTDDDEGGIGVENGYAADADLSVTVDDGLNDSELRAVKSRAMARVEEIRQLEFKDEVPIRIVSREEYRTQIGDGKAPETKPWEEQFWEAAFIVDENTTVSEARRTVYGSTVQGFFNGSHIVLITDGPEAVSIDRGTLVHELVHALQAQYFSLGTGDSTYDGRMAETAVVEGDANYVEHQYQRRCGTEWSCIPQPGRSGGGGNSQFNGGLFVSVFLPYSDGPSFVGHLRDEGGWESVNEAFDRRPSSTEQVIHPERYPDDDPTAVVVSDRSDDDWHRLETDEEDRGVGYRSDRIGEATLFAMLWYNGVIAEESLTKEGTDLSPYDYSHPLTDGWEGDTVVPYTNGSGYGYVFKSTWESNDDARQFYEAYLKLLETHDAVEVRDGVYRISDGGYADAFRVVRNGKTVVVVNAPTVAALADVHAPSNESSPKGSDEEDEGLALSGFGTGTAVAGVVAGLLAVAVAARRRRT